MIYDVAGWFGACCLLCGFVWALRDPRATQRRPYLLLNILGALGIVINTYHAGAYPAALFNIIWAAAGMVTLVKRTPIKSKSP